MQKTTIILSLFLIWPTLFFAQSWEDYKASIGTVQKIIKTDDQNFILVGGSNMSGVVQKIDKKNTKIWEFRPQKGELSAFASVIELSDKSIVAVGSIKKTVSDKTDFYVVKLSHDGKLIWSKTFKISDNHDDALAVGQLNDNSIIVAGKAEKKSNYNYYSAIVKIDVNGNKIAEKKRTEAKPNSINELIIYKGNTIIVAGEIGTNSYQRYTAMWYAAFDENLEIKWEKQIKNSYGEALRAICFTSDNFIYMTGIRVKYGGSFIPV